MKQSPFNGDKAGHDGHGPYQPPVYQQLALGIGAFVFGIAAARDSNVSLAALLLGAAAVCFVLAARTLVAARRGHS